MAIVTILIGLVGCHGPATLEKFEYHEPKWGTAVKIVLFAPDKAVADRASAAAFARIDEIGKAVSDYDPESELNQLCRLTDAGPMAGPVPVSEHLYRILERSLEASSLTDGAFDVTVGPFVKQWRRSRDLGKLPTAQRIEDARASVGYQKVKLDSQAQAVQLLAGRMRLDFGGIATGYAVDEALTLMRKKDVSRVLIDFGGDLGVGDPPPEKDAWRVAIQLLSKPGETAGYINLCGGGGVSTSGDTYRFVEIDGKRYSHIIDPKTGLGLTDGIGVTAIAADDITADWLSTAISVLGREKGLTLVEQIPGAAARITSIENGSIRVDDSSRFRTFISE